MSGEIARLSDAMREGAERHAYSRNLCDLEYLVRTALGQATALLRGHGEHVTDERLASFASLSAEVESAVGVARRRRDEVAARDTAIENRNASRDVLAESDEVYA